MNILNKLFIGSALIASMGAMQACSEDNTLEGATDVYVEIAPTNIELQAGDTVQLSAVVTNVSGNVIDTPVKWSVDDESVAKVVDIVRYEKVKGAPTTEGEAPQYVPVVTKGITGMQGAQGRITNVRATLENGKCALTPVSVVFRSLRNALTMATTFKRSYQRQPNDTVWFNLQPIELVDEFTPSYELTLDEVYPGIDGSGNIIPVDESSKEFTFPNDNPADNIVVDRELSRIGVVYTAPRLSGKASCTLKLTNGTDEVSCKSPILVYPKVSPGFEVNGKRPLAQEPNPSNIKILLMSMSMDINSTYELGVCLGVEGGWDQEIFNVHAAEQSGMFKWTVNGSSVIVEDMHTDFNYVSGYVTYLKLRSGVQEGLTVIRYEMPDTVAICNLSVENYNTRHPVDRIITESNGVEVDEVDYTVGTPASMDVYVAPDASFEYHVPEVVSLDPTIITVEPRGEDDGYTRRFNPIKAGVTYLEITSLEKTKRVKVTVHDVVNRVAITPTGTVNLMSGETVDFTANVYMASNINAPTPNIPSAVTWVVSDPSVASATYGGPQNSKMTLTGLTDGTVTVYAVCEGRQSPSTTVKVTAIKDVNYGASDDAYINVGDDESLISVSVGDLYVEFPATYDADNLNFVTTASGKADYLTFADTEYENCSFSVTITAGADGDHFVINGYFTLPNGMKIILTNVVAEVG